VYVWLLVSGFLEGGKTKIVKKDGFYLCLKNKTNLYLLTYHYQLPTPIAITDRTIRPRHTLLRLDVPVLFGAAWSGKGHGLFSQQKTSCLL